MFLDIDKDTLQLDLTSCLVFTLNVFYVMKTDEKKLLPSLVLYCSFNMSFHKDMSLFKNNVSLHNSPLHVTSLQVITL